MIYNGHDLSDVLMIEKVNNAPIPGVTITTQSAPGRNGARFVSKNIGTRTIQMDVVVAGQTRTEYMERVRDIAKILITPDVAKLSGLPGDECFYNAVLSKWTMQKLMTIGKGSIEFFCADPYAYRMARALPLNETIAVLGTVYAQGVITQVVNEAMEGDITFTLDGTTRSITILGPFALDDRIEIDTFKGYATLNGANCMDRVSVLSDWFELPADACKIVTAPDTLEGGHYTYLERWL